MKGRNQQKEESVIELPDFPQKHFLYNNEVGGDQTLLLIILLVPKHTFHYQTFH